MLKKVTYMTIFKSFLIAVSTYSAIPVPQFRWDEKNMKYAICFFPAVGIACALLLWGWYALCLWLKVSSFFFAAAAVCLPLLLTGGIHMDGYMDTADALASHQPRERKLEIMKDPNCGAFAVIYCGIYLLLQAGLAYELYEARCVLPVLPAFVLSRSLSGLCAVNLPNARGGGMLQAFTKDAVRRSATTALALFLLAGAAACLLLSPIVGAMSLLGALISVLIYRSLAMRQFGGVTGDTSGFFLQLCELMCLLGAWLGTALL